jgi:hypothetical protein
VTGTGGDDRIIGGAGRDVLNGGPGDDLYRFDRHDGRDLILDADPAPNHDRIGFGEAIRHDQLWFNRVGNDLTIELIGTRDEVTVQNWYASTDNRSAAVRRWLYPSQHTGGPAGSGHGGFLATRQWRTRPSAPPAKSARTGTGRELAGQLTVRHKVAVHSKNRGAFAPRGSGGQGWSARFYRRKKTCQSRRIGRIRRRSYPWPA